MEDPFMINFLKFWNSNKRIESIDERVNQIKKRPIPSHVAIIMDGNGRWAKKRALPRIAGHHEGMKTVRKITILANKLNIKTLSLYAFSTENWKRPKQEVDYLMGLPNEFLGNYLPELISENVKVTMIGDKSKLPLHTQKAVDEAIQKTANNTGLNLNFALNYGGRAEIIEAVKAISIKIKEGSLDIEKINEQCIQNHLMTNSISDPDLLIRTSGELRISNFMLWQIAYTELWFTDTFWPDFSEHDLLDAIEAYQNRSRRYGGLKDEESKK